MSKKGEKIYIVWQDGMKTPSAFRFKTDLAKHLGISYKTVLRSIGKPNKYGIQEIELL